MLTDREKSRNITRDSLGTWGKLKIVSKPLRHTLQETAHSRRRSARSMEHKTSQ